MNSEQTSIADHREVLKNYKLNGKEVSKAEAAQFMKTYELNVKKPIDRHMIMLKHVSSDAKVLDYGSGWGLFSKLLAEKGCTVEGIDQDSSSVEIAKDIIGESNQLKFSTKSIQEIPDKSFDVVISNQVIEHTHNPGNYLLACNRVLKKGGYLIIATPNIINPQFFLYQLSAHPEKHFKFLSDILKTKYDKTADHIQGWDPNSFCRLLCTMGFEFEAHEYMEGVPFPGPRIWFTRLRRLKNLSYTMMFKMKKYQDVKIGTFD